MHTHAQHIKASLIYLVTVLLTLIAYISLSKLWVPIGGISSEVFYFEIPFILTLSLLFYFPKIQNQTIKYATPIIPFVILYAGLDLFYNFLDRSAKPSDIKNIYLIFDFSVEMTLWLVISILIITSSMALLLYQAYIHYHIKPFLTSISYKLLFLCIIITTLSSDLFVKNFAGTYDFIFWSQEINIKHNGRFASFIYYGNQEKNNRNTLNKYVSSTDVNIHNSLYPGSIKTHKNIHFIVLESFINPALLKGIQFNRTPVAPELTPYLNEHSSFSKVISPVYGGDTAQAEFELLTGIKALAKIGSIEFNVMNGNKISSFVSHLKKHGYQTIATVATDRKYFNSSQAYKSLGFNEVSFLGESIDFVSNPGDVNIFDGTILDYNAHQIKNIIAANNRPIFNYVLGMYGHFPYNRNMTDRPNIIESNHTDKRINRISNQFFYRTKALAKYINNIVSIDPNSIIYITSDHLPPLLDAEIQYKLDKHINISILIENKQPINVDSKKYFEIPWFIWDLLSKEEHKRSIQDTEMEELYFKTLSKSLKIIP